MTIDHEHCLFSVALRLEGVGDPHDPRVLDRLGADELRRRVVRRVVTPALMRRVLRMFFDTRGAGVEHLAALRRGWLDVHGRARRCRQRLLELLAERIYSEPFMVIGTRRYRRAMAGIDVEEFGSRIDLDPETAVGASVGPSG